MVSCLGLDDETLVGWNSRENGRLLDGPYSNVGEGLSSNGSLLDSGGGGPAGFPATKEGGRRKEEEERMSTLELKKVVSTSTSV